MNGSAGYALEQFFGSYFHPDWDLDDDDWPEIVDGFVVGVAPDELNSLARDIDEFRASGQELELHQAMIEMGGFYDPRPEATYGSWLGQVASRLRQHAAERSE